MIIAAHQPNYLPNLAFFSKMKKANLFVIISNLQFEKQEGWQQRHKIPGPKSDIWLTVPVLGSQNQMIRDVKINKSQNWQKKHAKTLEIMYAKTKEKKALEKILAVYNKDWGNLADLNTELITTIAKILDIKTPIVSDHEISGSKHELIINIVKKYKGKSYLSGTGAKSYLDQNKLAELLKNNISHEFMEKNLGAEYPYSVVHYLLSEGKDWVINVL